MSLRATLSRLSIWLFAFGYFAAYVPYSATSKALSEGLVAGQPQALPGFALLPLSVAASVVGMIVFISVLRWWRFANQVQIGRFSLPRPGPLTALSGLCTAAIVATTTLAYTIDGASIVLMMLLMRGGLLVLAPFIDLLTGRKVRWYSGVALALSLCALLVAFWEGAGTAITLVAAVDVLIYLSAYFVRLRFMSRLAKSDDAAATKRYFVEEQMVATPAVMIFLGCIALFGGDQGFAEAVRQGFLLPTTEPLSVVAAVVMVGLCSQLTGVFGGLILLDRRENAYCVPVNRSSSILAGVTASLSLAVLLGHEPPSPGQLAGAGIIILAILFLSVPPLLESRRAASAGGGG